MVKVTVTVNGRQGKKDKAGTTISPAINYNSPQTVDSGSSQQVQGHILGGFSCEEISFLCFKLLVPSVVFCTLQVLTDWF